MTLSQMVPIAAAVPLVDRLAETLAARPVTYCQWKGHRRRERWASGEGDIDLLVARDSVPEFTAVMRELGFRPLATPAWRFLPGIHSYLGFDPGVDRLIHVHAHYRLVLREPWMTTYRLPVEAALLASATASDNTGFRTAAPVFALLLLVMRTAVRHTLRDALGLGRTDYLSPARAELAQLEGDVDPGSLRATLAAHLPCVEDTLFEACRRSFDADCPRWRRVVVGWTLRRRLRPYTRRPSWSTRLIRIAAAVLGRLGLESALPRSRLADGGTVVALVGPDGAGKSTCNRALGEWLGDYMATMTAHLGRPPRSVLTLLVGGLATLARWMRPPRPHRFPGYLVLLRILCTARDRYRLYAKAQRFAAAGGIALCERYPVPPHRLLVGPGIGRHLTAFPRRPLALLMHRGELALYRHMLPPDALLVLRVDPAIAVERKTDEPADYVRARARVMWDADWTGTTARIVDADRPFTDVLTELKARVWAEL